MDGKTEIAKDALPIGGQPSSEELNPSNPLEKVYMESEVNDLINQRHSKLDKQIAGLTKELTSADERVKAAEDALKQYQEQIDQAELEAARGDPDKLKELQAKKSYKAKLAEIQKREATQTKREAEHESLIKAAQEATLERKISELAVEHELNPQDIKDAMTELNLTTVDQAVAVAKHLGVKPKEPPKGPSKTDSLLTSRGGKDLSGKSPMQLAREAYEK